MEESKHEEEIYFIKIVRASNRTMLAKVFGEIKVAPEEQRISIVEVESHAVKVIAIRATGKLAKQKMCGAQ